MQLTAIVSRTVCTSSHIRRSGTTIFGAATRFFTPKYRRNSYAFEFSWICRRYQVGLSKCLDWHVHSCARGHFFQFPSPNLQWFTRYYLKNLHPFLWPAQLACCTAFAVLTKKRQDEGSLLFVCCTVFVLQYGFRGTIRRGSGNAR